MTLPLQLTIEIGQSASGIQLSAAAAPRQAAAPVPPAEAAGNGQHAALPAAAELAAAWRALESFGEPAAPAEALAREESAAEWLAR